MAGMVRHMVQNRSTVQQSYRRQPLQSSDVLRTLVRRIWILALGLVCGGVLGVFATLLMTPTYQASAYLIIVTASQKVENTAALNYTQAYSQFATVPSVVAPVLLKHDIEPTAQNITELVNVDVPPNSPVFQITVNAQDPDLAVGLVNDLAAKVSTFTSDRMAPSSGYRAVVVAEALTPKRPASPDPIVNTAAGATVGLFMGGVAALLWDDLWPGKRKR
jgi:capsular polysaccharide biosynthesis protein